jgi:hypothetical protein
MEKNVKRNKGGFAAVDYGETEDHRRHFIEPRICRGMPIGYIRRCGRLSSITPTPIPNKWPRPSGFAERTRRFCLYL